MFDMAWLLQARIWCRARGMQGGVETDVETEVEIGVEIGVTNCLFCPCLYFDSDFLMNS